jgi:hypothetical protein
LQTFSVNFNGFESVAAARRDMRSNMPDGLIKTLCAVYTENFLCSWDGSLNFGGPMSNSEIPAIDPLDRLIWGIPSIAKVISRTSSEAYYLAAHGHIDVDKVGGRYRSTVRRLLAPAGKAKGELAAE